MINMIVGISIVIALLPIVGLMAYKLANAAIKGIYGNEEG